MNIMVHLAAKVQLFFFHPSVFVFTNVTKESMKNKTKRSILDLHSLGRQNHKLSPGHMSEFIVNHYDLHHSRCVLAFL